LSLLDEAGGYHVGVRKAHPVPVRVGELVVSHAAAGKGVVGDEGSHVDEKVGLCLGVPESVVLDLVFDGFEVLWCQSLETGDGIWKRQSFEESLGGCVEMVVEGNACIVPFAV